MPYPSFVYRTEVDGGPSKDYKCLTRAKKFAASHGGANITLMQPENPNTIMKVISNGKTPLYCYECKKLGQHCVIDSRVYDSCQSSREEAGQC